MSKVLKFQKMMPSSDNARPKGASAIAEISYHVPGCINETPTNVRRDIRSIIPFLELAAFQLRRAGTTKPDPYPKEIFEEYLSNAEDLIEMARRKASGL
jgi:hypothetical protein